MGILSDNSTPHATHESGANQAGSFSIEMKSPKTFKQQLAIMKGRGLIVDDDASAISRLSESNYYRLRGYWLTFEDGERFRPGTTFDMIWDAYEFDDELRNLAWRAIEPVEIKARTLFAYYMATECGPVAHEDASYFKDERAHGRSMRSLERERRRALDDRVPCVVHNVRKYGDLPVWAAVEIMSMGTVSQLFGNLDTGRSDVARNVSSGFGIKYAMMKSWLRHLTYVRNICAHHSRLYNRVMTNKPKMLRADAWASGRKQFQTLMVLKRIYEKSWPERWKGIAAELSETAARHPGVDLGPMGFPDEWLAELTI